MDKQMIVIYKSRGENNCRGEWSAHSPRNQKVIHESERQPLRGPQSLVAATHAIADLLFNCWGICIALSIPPDLVPPP